MASFFHINFCQSRKNGFWWKWRWRKTGMIIKKDHQPAVLMFVLFSTKRQCACYQISHSAPISRATISSSRLVKAISNWVGYQNCKSLRQAALRCMDIADTRFWIGCKTSAGKWILHRVTRFQCNLHRFYMSFDDLSQCRIQY